VLDDLCDKNKRENLREVVHRLERNKALLLQLRQSVTLLLLLLMMPSCFFFFLLLMIRIVHSLGAILWAWFKFCFLTFFGLGT